MSLPAVKVYLSADPVQALQVEVRAAEGENWASLDRLPEKHPLLLATRAALIQALGVSLGWAPGQAVLVGIIPAGGAGQALFGRGVNGLEMLGASAALMGLADHVGAIAAGQSADAEPPTEPASPAS